MPAGPNGLSFVGVRFKDGERVVEVQVRAGTAAIAPGVTDTPQTDLAALDDVIFAEPQADLAPPPDTQFVPIDVPSGFDQTAATPPPPRASLITLANRSVVTGC